MGSLIHKYTWSSVILPKEFYFFFKEKQLNKPQTWVPMILFGSIWFSCLIFHMCSDDSNRTVLIRARGIMQISSPDPFQLNHPSVSFVPSVTGCSPWESRKDGFQGPNKIAGAHFPPASLLYYWLGGIPRDLVLCSFFFIESETVWTLLSGTLHMSHSQQ